MHQRFSKTIARAERTLRERLIPHIHTFVAPLQVQAWSAGPLAEPVSVAHVVGEATDEDIPAPDWEDFPVGAPWGAAWQTTWFKLRGSLPESSLNVPPGELEAVVDLGWFPHSVGGHCEAAAFTDSGHIIKGLHPKSTWIPLSGTATSGSAISPTGAVSFLIEAAANPLILGDPPFGRTLLGEKGNDQEAGFEPFRLKQAGIYRLNVELWHLSRELEVCSELAQELPEEDPRRWQLLRVIERCLDRYDSENPVDSAPAARKILAPALALPARASAHQITTVGHAHIDSAWFWPLRETKRKVGRTVSNVLNLMESDPDFNYSMTSAQHFEWLRERHPELFQAVKERIAQGRFEVVGGMWVETDGVIPTGESVVRQILTGQQYFEEHFGIEPKIVWLPDSFGYSGALPQIARRSGFRWFLTQKISWNDTTKFPHHSFLWEGIDGTRVFTHFPPADTYAAEIHPRELLYSVKNFRDKAIADTSLLLYGYGDGGGGPTREMLGRKKILADLDGSPRLLTQPAHQFFALAEEQLREAEADAPDFVPVWHGELYLELHRGTLTTQSAMKQGNRTCESLLRSAERAWATVATKGLGEYPSETLKRIWREVLLLQFHDILPGTSIKWVHADARQAYKRLIDELGELITDGESLLFAAETPAAPKKGADRSETTVTANDDGTVCLDNGMLRLTVDASGAAISLVDIEADRELIPSRQVLNQLMVFHDQPLVWDGWDIDRSSLRDGEPVTNATKVEISADGTVTSRLSWAESTFILTTRLNGRNIDTVCDVDWQTREHLLKVELPLAVHAPRVLCETQYGLTERTLYRNSAADDAAFEAPMHRFVHVSDQTYGVGVSNFAMYGMDAQAVPGGTHLGLSLVRSPSFPDPDTDLGRHRFHWRISPGATIADTVDQASILNEVRPLTATSATKLVEEEPVEGKIVLDWVKLAEDGSGDLILRAYEAQGGAARSWLTVPAQEKVAWTAAAETDLRERPLSSLDEEPLPRGLASVAVDKDVKMELRLVPFQIVTLRVSREAK